MGTLTVRAFADETGLSISEALATDGAGSQIRGSGKLLADGATLEGVSLTAQLNRPERIVPGLEGVAGLLASVELSGSVQSPNGTITLRADAFEANGALFENIRVNGKLTEGRLALDESTVTTPYGTATATADIGLPLAGRPLDAQIASFRWVEEDAELLLVEPVPIEISEKGLQIDGLRLASGDGEARVTFTSDKDAGWSLDLGIEALELEPFLAHVEAARDVHFGPLRGSARITSSGAVDALPRADVDLTLERSRDATAAPVAARVKASWIDEVVTFDDVVVELDAAQLQLAGSAPLGVGARALPGGSVNLQGRIGVDAEALMREPARSLLGAGIENYVARASGRAFGTASLSGTWDSLRGTMEVNLEDARFAPRAGEKPLLDEALSGRLALRLGDQIELERSGLELGSTATVKVQGSLDQTLSAAALLENPAARLEAWKNSALAMDADLEFSSLNWLARFLPELRATEGTLRGSASLRGSAADMTRSGRLVLSGGSARYRGLPPLENAEVTVRLQPELLTIENADLEIGAAPVSLGGTVLLGDGQPRFDLTIDGTEVLLARSADARLRGDLSLTLTGRADALRAEGDVKIVSGRLRSPIEFQSLLSGSSNAPQSVRRGIRIPSFGPETLALNVAVTTADPVSLRGRIARGSIRADLRLIGTADHPTPIGEVFFDPLELAVPAGTIEFPTGLVRFSPDAPDIPQIDLVGTTRLAGYDVTVNVEGAYDEPDVDLSSSPPLAPEDLLLLVLSGQPPSQGGGIEAAGQSVALYVAKDLVRGWFSSGGFEEEDRESFLDRLEVTTGRDVSRSGTLTVEATYKLREGFARQRDALYVVLERDSYEDYGLGLRLVLRLR
ncbi:MAG: translocation/assembly module TamB domain-containing protein [Planctomycetota bacterium]